MDNNEYIGYHSCSIGTLRIKAKEEAITAIEFVENKGEEKLNSVIVQCKKQLDEYFQGNRKSFHVHVCFNKGTEFQIRVWNALKEIPYGTTVSYKDIAEKIGNPKAVRAVGGANNKNPISIIVPCHRVIGKNGKLIGYGGGIDKKEFLLKLERNNCK